MYGFLIAFVGLGLILAGWEMSLHRADARKRKVPSLSWMQFEHCHEDISTGVITASGALLWGGRPDTLAKFSQDWHPPFEIEISANGRDIVMIVTDMHTTVGSSGVQWNAQDKSSYVAEHRFS